MSESIVVQQVSPAIQLILLFHGVGATADDLVPLGRWIAAARPQAYIVSIGAPTVSDFGRGRQWFAVHGITEETRPARVAEAFPGFIAEVRAWQARSGVDAAGTTLIGFSQGGIMALAATQSADEAAGRVIALSSRFASPPTRRPAASVHLLHGERDPLFPAALSRQAHEQLRALGASATLDVYPGLGHGIDARVAERVLSLL